ncbi:glycerophosphodiester phosphodiesterase family protein [Pseudooceanicola sp. C21-150M6]|uniref:glycerophosphodiester phosphodiesterase family protein n=1 Tax=Pseudooceanicola sp. C21-150M6 TaxID=3434355 RepID=UPI003D7FF0E2
MTAITGHRGAGGLHPENSLTGFRRAAELGCDAIEFDVHPTRSGALLVIHDATLERTTSGRGAVTDLDAEAQRDVRLKGSSEPIPTLDQVLETLAPCPAKLHVEIKADAQGDRYPGVVGAVTERLQAHGLASRAVLTSFDPEVLEEARAQQSDIGRLISANEAWIERHGGLDAFFRRVEGLADLVALHHGVLGPSFDRVTSRWPIDRLCVWTVNEADAIAGWLDRGIGHLTSDRPDLALALREARAPLATAGAGDGGQGSR